MYSVIGDISDSGGYGSGIKGIRGKCKDNEVNGIREDGCRLGINIWWDINDDDGSSINDIGVSTCVFELVFRRG